MAISDVWLKANNKREREKIEVFTDRDGLSVRASVKGKLVFQLRYRFNGKEKRLDLGSYPLIGLKKAREKALELRAAHEQGKDPQIVHLSQRLAYEPNNSFRSLYLDYHNKFASHHKVSAKETLASLELHVFPEVGSFPANEIAIYSWVELLEKITLKAPAIAERILTAVRQMYAWAIRMQRVTANPVKDLSAKADLRIKRSSAVRSINDEELRNIWIAIFQSNMAPKNRIMMQLLLMWGCRIGELRLAKKSDFDLDSMVWTIPPENHKTGRLTGRPLKRPILPEMRSLIKQLFMMTPATTDHAFSVRGADRPISDRSHLSFPLNLNIWIERHLDIKLVHWSVHDFRGSARSRWSSLAPPHICEIALGHALPAMWQTYDHHDYLEEQTELYKAWLVKLEVLVDGDTLK